MRRQLRFAVIALTLFASTSCSTMYYKAMETVGKTKRDIMVSRVEAVKEDQKNATEEFQSALQKFSAIVKVKGGELEPQYNSLKSELDACRSRAKTVRDRIASIEDVSGALFSEWEDELSQYSNQDLRRASEKQLALTKARYQRFDEMLHKAESRMDPVLTAFNDQVLFLKHNLNAQAIASIQGEVDNIEGDVQALITEMNRAIAEANAFIDQMKAK